jgi:hypothetical protein
MNKLTQEQKALFDALHEDKVQDYKVFSKRDYGRLFSSLIDKYPETAHSAGASLVTVNSKSLMVAYCAFNPNAEISNAMISKSFFIM